VPVGLCPIKYWESLMIALAIVALYLADASLVLIVQPFKKRIALPEAQVEP